MFLLPVLFQLKFVFLCLTSNDSLIQNLYLPTEKTNITINKMIRFGIRLFKNK